jgi:hypothetical protein
MVEWVTPDLVQIFQSNEIIANGLRNPKCAAALQLMQQNPAEAQKRFQGDPDIDRFMKEFGKVMASHFDKLGEAQNEKMQPPISQPKVQPIGPLQAKAIQNQKNMK